MAKVIMVSRDFLRPHPRVGQSTYFVEKIFKGVYNTNPLQDLYMGLNLEIGYSNEEFISCHPKWHTVRGGNRWKVGDKISLRVWSGKPYRSPQIKICDEQRLRVENIWNIETAVHKEPNRTIFKVLVDGTKYSEVILSGGKIIEWFGIVDELAKNDGLDLIDFFHWFDVPHFKGQIICWNKDIQY